jgi:pilus assembly protein CpaB
LTRRFLTIILAILLAVIGTGAVLLYVKQADKRAMQGLTAVTVLVAAQQIPAGTSASAALRDGLLVRQQVPAKSVAGTDYVSKLTPELGLLVASTNIPSGQLLLRPMLVTAVTSTSGIAIPSGDVAVTIALCVPEAVAGYVSPGSQVAIFDTTGGGGGGCSSAGGGSTGSSTSGTSSGSGQAANKAANTVNTRIVLPQVTVLAIGQASAVPAGVTATNAAFSQGTSTANNGTVLVTLAVNQSDAERVISLAESGLPYLALLAQSRAPATGPDHGTISLFPPFK